MKPRFLVYHLGLSNFSNFACWLPWTNWFIIIKVPFLSCIPQHFNKFCKYLFSIFWSRLAIPIIPIVIFFPTVSTTLLFSSPFFIYFCTYFSLSKDWSTTHNLIPLVQCTLTFLHLIWSLQLVQYSTDCFQEILRAISPSFTTVAMKL